MCQAHGHLPVLWPLKLTVPANAGGQAFSVGAFTCWDIWQALSGPYLVPISNRWTKVLSRLLTGWTSRYNHKINPYRRTGHRLTKKQPHKVRHLVKVLSPHRLPAPIDSSALSSSHPYPSSGQAMHPTREHLQSVAV